MSKKVVVDNVGRQPLPVIAREYVEKNYIHKDKLKEKLKQYMNESYDWYLDSVLEDLLNWCECQNKNEKE